MLVGGQEKRTPPPPPVSDCSVNELGFWVAAESVLIHTLSTSIRCSAGFYCSSLGRANQNHPIGCYDRRNWRIDYMFMSSVRMYLDRKNAYNEGISITLPGIQNNDFENIH